ncbi:S8 family peptidase [Ramlibacter humi]|nr:S8/S53 family peptidase [Ramlibacter humi]
MSEKRHAKVVIPAGGPDFEQYRQRLAQLADPGVDMGLLQVGVHEAVLRPHLALHLAARHPGTPLQDLLVQAGAQRVEFITEADALALANQRVPEDLQPKPVVTPLGNPQWHLDKANVLPAWVAVGGPDDIDWGGIVVGQIDTGFTRHEAYGFPGTSWLRTDLCRTMMTSQIPSDYGPAAPQPDNGVDPMFFGALNKGHGTRIGATISGCGGNLPGGLKFYGVAPKVPHVVVRITDTVAINTHQDDFVDALTYLVDVVRADVVNVSLGIFPPVASAAIRNVMAYARSRGTIVVCAAGNYVDPVVVPAALDTAIAVAGVTAEDQPWSGSSFGPQVAFSAPANNLWRPEPQRNGVGAQFAGGGDGTSYATAITTGAAALWLRAWGPQINAMYGGRTARRAQAFKAAVQATCRQPANWQPQPFGAGIIDIGRLCTDMAKALPVLAGAPALPPVPAPAVA